jgi:hypothetical protein
MQIALVVFLIINQSGARYIQSKQIFAGMMNWHGINRARMIIGPGTHHQGE